MSEKYGFKALGESAKKNKDLYKYSNPNKDVLEYFEVTDSRDNEEQAVVLNCLIINSLCPITGQPDHGEIRIMYEPNTRFVETKSLKLYLNMFRHEGIFGELLVRKIARDLFDVLQPKMINVSGKFASRGDISIQPDFTIFQRNNDLI